MVVCRSLIGKVLLVAMAALVVGCASTPPKRQDNICHIFDEKDKWYKQAKKASKRWGIPIATNMAIMHQESRYVSKAKPPRKKILGFIPGPRKSSAYGYPQAKDETWDWYKDKAGNWGADRDKYKDAIDFIAWYNSVSVKRNRVKPNDTYRLYLAYHEGHGGFSRGTYKSKGWLVNVAKKVDSRARNYQSQLNKCEDRLDSSWWWPF